MQFYKNSDVSAAEVTFEASLALTGFYMEHLEHVLETLVKAKASNQPLDFSNLEVLIEDACDAECITIEQERHYDTQLNLFV